MRRKDEKIKRGRKNGRWKEIKEEDEKRKRGRRK